MAEGVVNQGSLSPAVLLPFLRFYIVGIPPLAMMWSSGRALVFLCWWISGDLVMARGNPYSN